MVTLLSDKKVVVMEERGTNKHKFEYEDFYNAFHKAVSNSNDYDYTCRACKQHNIDDSGKSIGLIPQPESTKDDFISRNSSETEILKVHDLSCMSVDSFISARELYFIVSESEIHKTEELKAGEVVKYPEIWQRKGEKLVLNESFRVECDTASFAIESVLERAFDSDIAKFRFGDYGGRRWCFKYLSENSPAECIYCGRDEEIIFISKDSGSSYLYCSGICLGCLPGFMSKYLDYDKSKVSSLIVSNNI